MPASPGPFLHLPFLKPLALSSALYSTVLPFQHSAPIPIFTVLLTSPPAISSYSPPFLRLLLHPFTCFAFHFLDFPLSFPVFVSFQTSPFPFHLNFLLFPPPLPFPVLPLSFLQTSASPHISILLTLPLPNLSFSTLFSPSSGFSLPYSTLSPPPCANPSPAQPGVAPYKRLSRLRPPRILSH